MHLQLIIPIKENPHGTGANVLDCDITASSNFSHYVYFQTNTIGKSMNHLIPTDYSSTRMALALSNPQRDNLCLSNFNISVLRVNVVM